LKARAVAGNRALGARLVELTRPFVWPDSLDPDAVREIRSMKERAEAVTNNKGLADRELKRGRGGIRDIEFAVQLLQLVHGRHDASVRSATTLDALASLATGGYVNVDDAVQLDAAYRFLRTVEHRLQLYDEQQTHTLPSDDAAHTAARVLGYRSSPERRRARAFDADHRAPTDGAGDPRTPLLRAAASKRLRASDLWLPARPRSASPRSASPTWSDPCRDPRACRRPHPALEAHATAVAADPRMALELPDPDLRLAVASHRRGRRARRRCAVTFAARREPPSARVSSPRVEPGGGRSAAAHPEFVEDLGDDDELHTEKTRLDCRAGNPEWRTDPLDRRRASRRFKRRELLRIAGRDLRLRADGGGGP
jgi:hypothetical protein